MAIDSHPVLAVLRGSQANVRALVVTFALTGLAACTTGGPFGPSASLVAVTTSEGAPGAAAAASCPAAAAAPASGAVQTSGSKGAQMLALSLARVRHEYGIRPIAFDRSAYAASLDVILREALDLRVAKQAAAQANTPATKQAAKHANGEATGAGAPAATKDDVEAALVALLPDWAGNANLTLPVLAASAKATAAQVASGVTPTDLPEPAATAVTAGLGALGLAIDKAAPLNTLVSATVQSAPSPADHSVATFDRSDHKKLFSDFQSLEVLRTFHLMTLISAARLHTMLVAPAPLPDPDALDAEVRIFNLSRFLSTYFDAYFRGGHFLQVTSAGKTVMVAGSTAFVTRAGMTVQFAGIDYAIKTDSSSISLHHTYPSALQFGPQLVRVFVEAVFDANGLSPKAVSNSTACAEKLFDATDCITSATSNGKPTQDEQVTQDIDSMASASESLTTAAAGAIIRGLNAVALNNETVAQVLETFAGVTARKITEKLAYLVSIEAATKTCPARTVTASLMVQ